MRTTVFDLYSDDELQNVVYVFFDIRNRTSIAWDSLFVTFNCDPDIGDATDDFAATDTTLMAAMAYNGFPSDRIYRDSPPAAGVLLLDHWLNGDKLKREFSAVYISKISPPPMGFPADERLLYFAMTGRDFDGNPVIDPLTGQPSRFVLTGDPVTQEGWLDSFASDREIWTTTGPYEIQPGDRVTVAYALCVGQDTSNIQSVARLRETMQVAFEAYQSIDIITGLRQDAKTLLFPQSFEILPNYPNPFNEYTNIVWQQSQAAEMTLKMYDIAGRLVETLFAGQFAEKGTHRIRYVAKKHLSPGIYFLKLTDSQITKVQKIIILPSKK